MRPRTHRRRSARWHRRRAAARARYSRRQVQPRSSGPPEALIAGRVRHYLKSPPANLEEARGALAALEGVLSQRRAALLQRLTAVCGAQEARSVLQRLLAQQHSEAAVATTVAVLDEIGCGQEGWALLELARLAGRARRIARDPQLKAARRAKTKELGANLCEYLARGRPVTMDVSGDVVEFAQVVAGMDAKLARGLMEELGAPGAEHILAALRNGDRHDAVLAVLADTPRHWLGLTVSVAWARWLLVAVADPDAVRATGSFGWSELALGAYLEHHRARPAPAVSTLASELAARAESSLDEAVSRARTLRAVCEERAARSPSPAGSERAAMTARQLAVSLECRRYDRRSGVPRRRLLDRYALQEQLRLLAPDAWLAALTASHEQAFCLFAQAGLITGEAARGRAGRRSPRPGPVGPARHPPLRAPVRAQAGREHSR
jgi:hypothetical protein